MNQLRIQNVYSWLSTSDVKLKDLLWKNLRFRAKGYFFNPLYKQKKWDGFEEFFNRNSGRFLTGLLPEVELAMKYLGVDCVVQDERGSVDFIHKKIDENFLLQWKDVSGKEIVLHDYQHALIENACLQKRGIIQAATNAGKTYILVGILKNMMPNTPTLIMTKSVDLTRQIYNDLEPWGIDGLGKVFGSSKKDFKPGLVTVVNIDSAHRLEKLFPYFSAVICDEVHGCLSKIPKQIYKRLSKASVRLGISATPFKNDSKDLVQKYECKGFFGPIIKADGRIVTTKELQERGISSQSKCTFYPIDEPDLQYETYQSAVTLGVTENFGFNQIIARLAQKQKGRTLLLVDRIKQGELLESLIPGCEFVYGKDTNETRERCIGLLGKSEQCIFVVQQQLISSGLNIKIHNLINCFSSVAEHNLIQRMGRGLRISDDKEMLNYYDFLFSNNTYLQKHSHQRIKTLRSEGHEVIVKDEIDF